MSRITTHVLDTSRGRPAEGVPVTLELRGADGAFTEIGRGVTDSDGRLRALLPDGAALTAGIYRLTFDTATYFRAQGTTGFYPSVPVVFEVSDPAQHHHVPLLLSRFGFSTYRGS
jgi:5-hydroxyisourate hydrolase